MPKSSQARDIASIDYGASFRTPEEKPSLELRERTAKTDWARAKTQKRRSFCAKAELADSDRPARQSIEDSSREMSF
jgi:hypothetical protein